MAWEAMVATMKPMYTVIAERDGDWWAISVRELNNVFSQARRLDRVEYMARDAISLMLEVPPDSFDIEVIQNLDSPTQEQLELVKDVREAVAIWKRRSSETTRETVRSLAASGYPQRDIGRLVGISHQRVAQLLAGAGED